MTRPENAIVLVIDWLAAGMLGPYGNTWTHTPAFNRLASESHLFETAVVDDPTCPGFYRAAWTGQHALCGDDQVRPSLPQLLRERGLAASLISDDAGLVDLELAREFEDHVLIEPPQVNVAAADVESTQAACLFTEVIDQMVRAERPFLLWAHARGLGGPWDAPTSLRHQFADEDDPVPPDFVVPPARAVATDEDPDLLLGIMHACAGQIAVFDQCLDVLLDAIDTSPFADTTALVVTSPRGFPLGEHGRIGGEPLDHYEELLHVPTFIRWPRGESCRRSEIVQTPDLFATLRSFWQLPTPAGIWGCDLHPEASRARSDRAVSVTPASELTIRTPAWFLRPDGRLYVKPDDRWEANEVSDRCVDIASGLTTIREDFRQAAAAGDRAALAPLPDDLVEGPE